MTAAVRPLRPPISSQVRPEVSSSHAVMARPIHPFDLFPTQKHQGVAPSILEAILSG